MDVILLTEVKRLEVYFTYNTDDLKVCAVSLQEHTQQMNITVSFSK